MRSRRMRPARPESFLKEVKSYEYLADNTDHSGGSSGLRWIRILKTGEVIVVSESGCSEGAGSTQTNAPPLNPEAVHALIGAQAPQHHPRGAQARRAYGHWKTRWEGTM